MWERNWSTGDSILRVADNARIIRMRNDANVKPQLYAAEFWGDYSLRFPLRGYWRKTLKRAKRDAQRMAHLVALVSKK